VRMSQQHITTANHQEPFLENCHKTTTYQLKLKFPNAVTFYTQIADTRQHFNLVNIAKAQY